MKTIVRTALLALIVAGSLLGVTGAASAASAATTAPAATDDLVIEIDPYRWQPPFTWLNLKPYYNDYIQCVGSWMYADFVDPDGNDALQTVTVVAYKNGAYHWRTMGVSSGAHGVFFYIERNAAGISGATSYYLRSTDSGGASSPWTYVSANCNGTQV